MFSDTSIMLQKTLKRVFLLFQVIKNECKKKLLLDIYYSKIC